MVNLATVVAVCVGVFSLTVRYTKWFQIKDSWLITFAAGLLQVWALLEFIFCEGTATETFAVVFATLVALINHGYHRSGGTSFSNARTRLLATTLICAFYLAAHSRNDRDEKCHFFTFVFTAFILIFFAFDFYSVHLLEEQPEPILKFI